MSDIFIELHKFDPSRLVIEPAKEKSFGKKPNKIVYYVSDGYYKDDNGKPCKLYLEFPEQDVWGFNAMYPMGTVEIDKDPMVNMKNIQICYPMTSLLTLDKATADEAYAQEVFQELWNITAETMKTECSKKRGDRKVPPVTYSSYVAADKEDDWKLAVKPVSAYPKSQKDDTKEDRSKPKRAYIKLNTFGKGADLICNTAIYGPGDRPLNARSLIDEKGRGRLKPVFSWQGIYWGAHGKKPWGASVTLRLAECNYVPGHGQGPSRRMLSRNVAPVPDDDSSFAPPSGETDEGFTPAGGDSSDPADALDDKEEPEEPKPRARKKAVRKKARRRTPRDN